MHWTHWAATSLKAATWRKPWGGQVDHQPVTRPCWNSMPGWILQAEHSQQVEGENLSLLLSSGGTCQEWFVHFWVPQYKWDMNKVKTSQQKAMKIMSTENSDSRGQIERARTIQPQEKCAEGSYPCVQRSGEDSRHKFKHMKFYRPYL